MEFFKIFALVLFFGGATCGVMGLIPTPILVVAALGILVLAIYHHRNRSLV